MKRSQAKLSALLETASIRVKSAQDDVDKCKFMRGKTRRSVESVLAHIKKEEALLLDLLGFMRNFAAQAPRLYSGGAKIQLDAER